MPGTSGGCGSGFPLADGMHGDGAGSGVGDNEQTSHSYCFDGRQCAECAHGLDLRQWSALGSPYPSITEDEAIRIPSLSEQKYSSLVLDILKLSPGAKNAVVLNLISRYAARGYQRESLQMLRMLPDPSTLHIVKVTGSLLGQPGQGVRDIDISAPSTSDTLRSWVAGEIFRVFCGAADWGYFVDVRALAFERAATFLCYVASFKPAIGLDLNAMRDQLSKLHTQMHSQMTHGLQWERNGRRDEIEESLRKMSEILSDVRKALPDTDRREIDRDDRGK